MKLENVFKNALGIKKNERVLIITDRKKEKIAKKIFDACIKLSNKTFIIFKNIGKYHGEEPEKGIAKLMLSADVIIVPTARSLTHAKAVGAARKKGARVATLPGITEEMYEALFADPKELRALGDRINNFIRGKNLIRVVTPSGTDIIFSIKGRWLGNDCAFLSKKGSLGNLPAGESETSPLEGTANGVIIIDSMRNGKEIIASKGTKVIVRNGKAVSISNKSCTLAKAFKTVKNATNIAELGIGTNKKAKLIGNILQDEKVYGTCHIAFGNSTAMGGKVYSKMHLDAILFKPKIYADGKLLKY